jgi:folate-binding protein YgfZ
MERVMILQPERALIRLTGGDRAAFLHNMTTNDVKGLAPGQGCPAVVVNQRGLILDWVGVYAGAEEHWVIGSPGKAAELMAWFDKYLITEDVALEDRSQDLWLGPGPGGFDHDGKAFGTYGVDGPGAFYLEKPAAREVATDDWEALRVQAGLPLVGKELTEQRNPWEGRLDESISLAKGCYLGQEIVARLNAYDKVQRYMVGLAWETAPAEGEKLFLEDKEVGYVSSVQPKIGLGFAKGAQAQPGMRLQTASGISMTVEDRPFWAGKTRAVSSIT